jgi:hypothetical protein
VREKLPQPLAQGLSRAACEDGSLILFTESAAWGARLRFGLAEAAAPIRAAQPQLKSLEVRVTPPRGRRRP